MKDNIAPNNLATINFNLIEDKKLGDFNSKLWATIGYDKIRDDLLLYYKACQTEIIKNTDHNLETKNDYDLKRNSYPNNCFTYASGLIVTGNVAMEPHHIKHFDFSVLNDQELSTSMDEYMGPFMQSIETAESFKQEMKLGNIQAFDNLDTNEHMNYNPIISLLYDNDYHFVKVDIYQADDYGPMILFSQKSLNNIIKCTDFKTYMKDFPSTHGRFFRDPQAFGSPNYLIDRQINTQETKTDFFKISLKPLPA